MKPRRFFPSVIATPLTHNKTTQEYEVCLFFSFSLFFAFSFPSVIATPLTQSKTQEYEVSDLEEAVLDAEALPQIIGKLEQEACIFHWGSIKTVLHIQIAFYIAKLKLLLQEHRGEGMPVLFW